MLKNHLNIIKQKKGMSLVEVMTAMTILTLMIFCFAPLFLSYFNSIDIAGDRLDEIQYEAGVLQRVIGSFNKAEQQTSDGYISSFQTIPLKLTSSGNVKLTETNENKDSNGALLSVTVSETGKSLTNSKTIATQAASGTLANITGSYLTSNPNDLESGFTTIYTGDIDAGFYCFPKSITDDFIKKDIIVVADGMNATTEGFKLYINIDEADAKDSTIYGEDSTGVFLREGVSWDIRTLDGVADTFVITLYGGKGVSYENSPVTITYGAYSKNIEVDAPMMIMVGEGNSSGEYKYYVSRGEIVDPNGDGTADTLAVLQRTMHSAPLTSAMNDVTWVPAESADEHAKNNTTQEPYGYYVMCGDNGQIRRFWREDDTTNPDGSIKYGNYYWGGDYTYYTNTNLNKGTNTYTLEGNKEDDGRVLSTNVSYKFNSRSADEVGNTKKGFRLAARDDKSVLQSIITSSITSYGSGDTLVFYGSDGKFFTAAAQRRGEAFYPDYTHSSDGITGFKNLYDRLKALSWTGLRFDAQGWSETDVERMKFFNYEAYAWLKTDPGSYFNKIKSRTSSTIPDYSIPITLTSADAIVLGNVGGEGYATSASGYSYPTKTYTLYAGYIPAVMDLWSSTTNNDYEGKQQGWDAIIHDHVIYEKNSAVKVNNPVTSYNTVRVDRYIGGSGAESTAYWKATLGVTPFITSDATSDNYDIDQANPQGYGSAPANLKVSKKLQKIFAAENWWNDGGDWGRKHTRSAQAVYFPYINLDYAFTGKFYDNWVLSEDKAIDSDTDILPWKNYSRKNGYQGYMTNGRVIDITVSYLSDPLAIHASLNPTDDIVYDQSNRKDDQIFYWNNRRESITLLDVASTVVPSATEDVPISLAVGYTLGGLAHFGDGNEVYPNAVMNNGIVLLRSGVAQFGNQSSDNSQTGESYAKNGFGYMMDTESNYFHQFYFLNSFVKHNKHTSADKDLGNFHGEWSQGPKEGTHFGNLYGAAWWQNNRHIDFVSQEGGKPAEVINSDGSKTFDAGSYEYLRCHPLSNTKVNCVDWGVTWSSNPEAMWGTENGTVLSWKVDLQAAREAGKDWDVVHNYNDQSVVAEFQSYKWVDNVDNRSFNHGSKEWKDTLGSAVWGSEKKNLIGTVTEPLITSYPFRNGDGSKNFNQFKYFYDSTSQSTGLYGTIGFISTLETINDIEYADDFWIAVGDQSDKNPADYCASGTYSGGGEVAKAYSGDGTGGSWVNVRYWVDTSGGKTPQSNGNDYYHWRAVKISTDKNCNIVQINNVNGMWIATGYVDGSNGGKKNDEYDPGEKPVICWTYDPLKPCGEPGGWSDKVEFYREGATSESISNTISKNTVGGINSCATRS